MSPGIDCDTLETEAESQLKNSVKFKPFNLSGSLVDSVDSVLMSAPDTPMQKNASAFSLSPSLIASIALKMLSVGEPSVMSIIQGLK